MSSFDAAVAARDELDRATRRRRAVNGVSIERVGQGYGLVVGLSKPMHLRHVPQYVGDVPVRTVVEGPAVAQSS